MTQQLPEEKVIETIQKLLNLAAKNPNEAEAASAAAKAQELLAKYNLDVATVEKGADVKAGKREQAMVDGGSYRYQRDLWEAVAQLNYCFHWVQEYKVWTKSKRVGTGRDRYTTEGYVYKKRHVVVGRIINSQSTITLAQYLQAAIERVTLERLGATQDTLLSGKGVSSDIQAQRFSNWAVSFRKGCARRVIEKLRDAREVLLKQEEKKRREDLARAERAGVSTATALTLTTLKEQETAANYDFLYGEGEWAKLKETRARQAKAEREADEAHAKWAKEHPEEARAQAEKERKAARRRGSSYGRSDNTDSGAYWSGYDKAADISLDLQVDKKSKVGGLLK
jgi:hypothetical protein